MTGLRDVFSERTWWTADVDRELFATWLLPRRGAQQLTIWRRSGDVFSERIDPYAELAAVVGDAFILCGPSIDETMRTTVEAVDSASARLRLRVALSGELAADTTVVRLTPIAHPKGATQRAKRTNPAKRTTRRRECHAKKAAA